MLNGYGHARTPRQVWQTALGQLQVEVNRANFATYLKDTAGASFDGSTFVVLAPSAFVCDWLETRLASTVKKTLIGILGQPVEVKFRVRSDDPAPRAVVQSLPLDALANGALPNRRTRLNPKYTFDTFVVGPSNRLAHAAAMAVAEQPGVCYNPMFIWGGVGLGKTHLLQAIGHAADARNLNVVYVSSETFTNEFIEAIRRGANEQFRQKYRSVDVLLIDDIQFLATKEGTQEEFFHTFNDLHGLNKQIVITSDRAPKSMPALAERLRSRFEWGLITDVEPPDFETRVAILESKARDLGLDVPTNVLQLIAHKFQSNIRELEGSLNKTVVFARSQGLPVTLDVAQQALLGPQASAIRRRTITPEMVLVAVAGHYHVALDDLKGKRRDREIAHPRHVAMHIIRSETQCTFVEIGAALGGRDHTTVMHGCEKIAHDLKTNDQLVREVNEIRTILYQTEPGTMRIR